MQIAELFKIVRAACSPHTWSRGVELSRQGGVIGENLQETEAMLRVTAADKPVSATVKLFFDEEDWLCDCQSTQKACEHVAAAVIALKRAKEQGQTLPVSAVPRGIVVYFFKDIEGALWFGRAIRVGDQDSMVTESLSGYLSGRIPGPLLSASKEDLGIDSLLRNKKEGVLASATLEELFRYLRSSEHVYLDDKKVTVGKPISRLRAIVGDTASGIRVTFEPRTDITKEFSNGAVLCGDELNALEMPAFTADERPMVREGKYFKPDELPGLVTDILPKLREKVEVEVTTKHLPDIDEDMLPRLVLQTSASGELLSVLPLIVYGNPPIARVDNGRLVFLENTKKVPVRQPAMETRLAASLHSEWGLNVGRRFDFRGEAANRFTKQMEDSRYEVLGNGIGYFGLKPALKVDLGFENEAMRLSFTAPGQDAKADPLKVFQAWREGLSRVPLLDNKGWAPIPTEWLERYGHRVLALLEAKDEKGKVAIFHRPEAARLAEDLEVPCPPDFSRLRKVLDTFTGIPTASLPKDLDATLRPYQQKGVDWLTFLRKSDLGALLADDMGLGKTLQAISVFSGRTLVVSPTSVLPNWLKEITRFRPKLKVSVYHGPDRSLDEKADVVLTTYAILRLDLAQLKKVEWDHIVLDEAQNIKNSESQSAQAAFDLKGKFKTALTGTPIENRLEDLWSIFQFLNPGFLGTRSNFQKTFTAQNENRLEDLRTKIKPFILRRLKQEVAPELPPRTELVLYNELDANEQIAYQTVLAATRKEVLEDLGKEGNVMAVLESLLRLRQAACHPALLPGQTAKDSSKVRLLLEKLEEVTSENHKALVFSQWTSLLDLIEPHLRKAKIKFCRIDGSTTNRQAIVDQFQSENGPPVMLMTLKAGGVGLNLTAADYVFLVDPWWNPAAEDQAADRAHRIGQTRPVFVHRLVTRGTVEEKILALQESKRAAAEGALSGTGRAAAITKSELLDLIS